MPDGSLIAPNIDKLQVRLRGELTETSWTPPPNMTLREWRAAGVVLGRFERSAQWWIGDWWAFGVHSYGERTKLVSAADWTGPSLKTCKNAASVCRKFKRSQRRDLLSYSHHAILQGLDQEKAEARLDLAERITIETGKAPSTREFTQLVKRDRRETREVALAASTAKASEILGEQLYSVILADPPWRFEVRSRETGLDRAAANHYPVMTTDDIAAMEIPAAKNCILFLWATNPMLRDALRVMEAWGFEYKANVAWIKPNGGTGYWFSSAHELLLLGVRGEVPAPAPGLQRLSWFQANRGRHSEKPDCVYTIIEGMFPNQPKLEMFSRKEREGWSRHGNELLEPT